jgi:hypothetical protein
MMYFLKKGITAKTALLLFLFPRWALLHSEEGAEPEIT